MSVMKTVSSFVLAGARAGAVLATFVTSAFIGWYNTPGGSAPALCNCNDVVRATTEQLVHGQLYGAAIGALVALVLGVLFVRARGHKAPHAAPPTPTA